MSTNENGKGGTEAALLERRKRIDEALAAARLNRQKREKRDLEKEDKLIGAAVRDAAAVFPDFKTMIAQTALARVTDEKQRRFLAERGWKM
jgi:hypothetical protein